jgi:hypothetical protein
VKTESISARRASPAVAAIVRSSVSRDDAESQRVSTPRRNRQIANAPRRALSTVAAATYLGVSAGLLRKLRARGPSDPGMAGPCFLKLSPNLVLYEITELDRWLDGRRPAAM